MDSTAVNIVTNEGFVREIISQAPYWLQIVFLLVIIPFGFLMYRFITNQNFRTDAIKLIGTLKREKVELNKHELFSYKTLSDTYIERLDVGSKLKNDIFQIILKKKVSIVIRNAQYFVIRYNTHLKDDANISLRHEFSDLVSRCIEEYEKEIFDTMKKLYKEDTTTLYNHIYKNAFEPYHSTNIAYILKVVDRFNNSKITRDQKVHMFFNLICVALDIAVLDCERTFRELNGSLKKYEEKYV